MTYSSDRLKYEIYDSDTITLKPEIWSVWKLIYTRVDAKYVGYAINQGRAGLHAFSRPILSIMQKRHKRQL